LAEQTLTEVPLKPAGKLTGQKRSYNAFLGAASLTHSFFSRPYSTLEEVGE